MQIYTFFISINNWVDIALSICPSVCMFVHSYENLDSGDYKN